MHTMPRQLLETCDHRQRMDKPDPLRSRFSTSAFVCVAFDNRPAMAERRLW
ncbi:MAG: hypothetical protein JWQ55_6163 [Rhodopila sp.]|nr:hypothetical protein [Rhodopila sp.]